MKDAIAFAAWFEESSERILGKYTENVERYLNEIRPGRYWKEDVIFCGRRRVEYHMNMVGAELMNRAYREAFLGTRSTLVLVPTCMRRNGDPSCKAKADGETGWMSCVGCCADCQVKCISDRELEHGYQVYMVPHSSDLENQKKGSDQLETAEDTSSSDAAPSFGVIGVACVLNLISGGWMLRRKGIPAQCVLLNYCGCKSHWHSEGIPTEIDLDRLEKCAVRQ